MTRVSQGVLFCAVPDWSINPHFKLEVSGLAYNLQLNKIKISPQFPTKWHMAAALACSIRYSLWYETRALYVLLLIIMQKLSITDIVTCHVSPLS